MPIQNEIKKIKICCLKKCDENCCEYIFDNNGQGLLPGKLNILYAPNGYGKTTFSQALKILSRNRNRIDIKKKEKYLLFEQREHCLNNVRIEFDYKIDDENETLISTKDVNKIIEKFEINVINSNLDVKGNRGYQGSVTAKMIIPDILIIKNIPSAININNLNFNLDFKGIKCYKKRIDKYTEKELENIEEFFKIYESFSLRQFNLLKEQYENYPQEFFCLFILYKKEKSKLINLIKYKKYKLFEKYALDLIENLKTFNFDIKFKNGILTFPPNAHLISNGQRDVLVFISKLLKAKWELDNSNKIYFLIIDEVFDYLDEANLLIAQYFLVNLIKENKKRNKTLYVLLMSHLSPIYFKHFYFSRLKKEFYLISKPVPNPFVEDIIKKRNESDRNSEDYNGYSKLLHFNPNQNYQYKGFSYQKLFDEINKEFEKYVNGETDYCPISVAIFLRISIEEYFYNKFESDSQKNIFMMQGTTIKKLNYIEKEIKNIFIPEECYLLGVIYNDIAHNESNEFLLYKFNNQIIKNLTINLIKFLKDEK